MPVIKLKADTLDEDTLRFAPAPLRQPLFLNSIQKSGSHLLQNILRMFVPLEQQYRLQFIQGGNFQQHLAAFDPSRNLFSFGHLYFSDASAIELAHVRKLLLFRDPYDWVLARARFFLSEEFHGNVEHLRGGRLHVDDLLSLMIFGVAPQIPSLHAMYDLNVAAWLASPDVLAVRYEELVAAIAGLDRSEAEAEGYFTDLFAAAGIDKPHDWRERILVGADRRQSPTARENLTGVRVEIPAVLPGGHRRLVDYHAPGLRRLLGYE